MMYTTKNAETEEKGGRAKQSVRAVYVVVDGAGLVKIGLASNPMVRLQALQTGRFDRLELIFHEWSARAEQAERDVHKLLHQQRLVGEWFEVSIPDAVAAVKAAIDALGGPAPKPNLMEVLFGHVIEPMPRINPGQLKGWRKSRELSGAKFGEFISDQLGRDRPYTRQEVNAWESGSREIPEAVERVYWQMIALNLNVERPQA